MDKTQNSGDKIIRRCTDNRLMNDLPLNSLRERFLVAQVLQIRL